MKLFSLRKNLAFNIISAIVLLLLLFSVLLSVIGYISFTNSLKREYTDISYRAASTAATLLDGNEIDNYLSNGEDDPAYRLSQERMDILCEKMDLTLIYVIKVDTTDYNSFVSVFNSVNKNSGRYTRWELGHFRETTNENYRQIYRDIYENGLEYSTIFRTKDLNGAEPHLTALVPVKNDAGKVMAILCVQRPMNELVTGRRPYLINVGITTVLLSILVSFIAALYLRRQFILPLRKVTEESERFAKENSAPKMNFTKGISNISEIEHLAASIDTMEKDTLRYMDRLTAVTAEKQRIGTELNIARQIQEGSVPSLFPPYPDRSEFDLYASMTPAKEVGGDFYDFYLIDDDHLALVIADVSGKGIPAALFMMVTKILISDRTLMGGTPGEILSFVNDRICENNKADMFVTVWMGILEISTGTITAANAGHDNPAIYRQGGSFEIMKTPHGPVIGALGGLPYKNFEIKLQPGDKIFLYTDGLPEATDANNTMYTMDGMLSALNNAKTENPKEVLSAVWEQVEAFVGKAPQFDDLTMLCLELKDNQNDAQELNIEALNENLSQVNDFVDSYLEALDCPMKTQMQIDLCVEEIFVNIAHYAYKNEVGTVRIQLSHRNESVILTFIDSGIPYDPLSKADPDISLSVQDRQIGGLGIFLVKKNMDDVSYRYENGKNIFTMTKKLK